MLSSVVALAQIQAALLGQQAERQFEERLKDLPPEVAQQARIERRAMIENVRQEAATERRHRELCDAIRSTSFWKFGG